MRTIPVLTKPQLALYHAHLQTDHDFRVWVEVLTMEEVPVCEVDVLDGQVNFARSTDDSPERTGSVTLSDPDGALQFGTSFAEDPTGTIWVNRLIRMRHAVTVPTLGEIVATTLVGVPTSVARKGGEVSIEMGDKSLLMDHGVRPRSYKKGARVDLVLRSIARDLTGEHHLRIPTTHRKLSRAYTVGMGENALTPWQAFKYIAGHEMGWRAFFACDGYLTCEPTATVRPKVDVTLLMSLPDSATTFTDFINYVKVTSRRKVQPKSKPKKPKKPAITYVFEGVGVLPSTHQLSEQGLARHGVPRTLPLVIDDNNLKTQGQVNQRTISELRTGSGLDYEQSYEIMPFFHMDTADKFVLPMGIGDVLFNEVSIPYGTSGNMTLGTIKWVSKPVTVKRIRSKTTVIRKKKKGGKKRG